MVSTVINTTYYLECRWGRKHRGPKIKNETDVCMWIRNEI